MQYVREKVTADQETPVVVPPPIMWPPVTPALSITPRDQARWQQFVNTHYDCRADTTEWIGIHSKLASDDTGSNSGPGQLPVQALTTPECEKQIREVLSSQIPIINYTSVKSQRFKWCSMWCWRVKQMQGEKTGARVIQKKIYIPRETEDRATNRQRWPVFCIHRAHSCRFLPRNIDRQCWKQTRTWIV